ncbi:MAG: hypothetical protein KAJ24_05645, partial [Candidatus Aenigmarchaeota archaeon]|nr:hypothetical protein [Candidatus Aenigmarchaeota archaeon]
MLIAIALIASPKIDAATDTDDFNITVNVSVVTQVTVLPTSLSWTALAPGTNGNIQNVSLSNTGTVNLSSFYASPNTITMEATNPLETGDPAAYAATGFMIVANETADSPYFHLGRLEWNLSKALAGEIFPTLEPNWSHGWYRNSTGNEYLWLLMNGTDGTCNASSGVTFQIKTAPENSTNLKRDHTTEKTNDVCGGSYTGPSSEESWGVFTCGDTANPLNKYYVATYYDCSKIYIYYYDRTTTFPGSTNVPFLWNETVVPGKETFMKLIAAL